MGEWIAQNCMEKTPSGQDGEKLKVKKMGCGKFQSELSISPFISF